MVQLQILNKVLLSKDISLIRNNDITSDMFAPPYDVEFDFILNHYEQYGNVPDKETFLSKFPDFDLVEVTESDNALLDIFFEEQLYNNLVNVVNVVANKASDNSNDAVEYLKSQLSNLTVRSSKTYVNIIHEAEKRLAEVEEKSNSDNACFIPTGFPELDNAINGWGRGEEFVVIFARTGQGKSWVLVKAATHAWEIGYNVGYVSPEMSYNRIGYRFDTHYNHFSNADLLSGRVNLESYREYISKLKDKDGKFIVAVPEDFNRRITVSKLRTFVKDEKLDMLCIDGIRYLSDERGNSRDNMTTSLTNISEDLMSLSRELKIPVLVVVQANRGGVQDAEQRGTPELESIRDSDGIAHNATKVISLRQTGPGLEMGIKKNRDGATNVRLVYTWDIDTGIFTYIPGEDDINTVQVRGHNGSNNNSSNSNQGRRSNSNHNDNSLANVQPERKVFADVTSPF